MTDKSWKTEYSLRGSRIAKGLGSTPAEADRQAKQQLNKKGIAISKKVKS
jgi:GTP cyclohydrolase III